MGFAPESRAAPEPGHTRRRPVSGQRLRDWGAGKRRPTGEEWAPENGPETPAFAGPVAPFSALSPLWHSGPRGCAPNRIPTEQYGHPRILQLSDPWHVSVRASPPVWAGAPPTGDSRPGVSRATVVSAPGPGILRLDISGCQKSQGPTRMFESDPPATPSRRETADPGGPAGFSLPGRCGRLSTRGRPRVREESGSRATGLRRGARASRPSSLAAAFPAAGPQAPGTSAPAAISLDPPVEGSRIQRGRVSTHGSCRVSSLPGGSPGGVHHGG